MVFPPVAVVGCHAGLAAVPLPFRLVPQCGAAAVRRFPSCVYERLMASIGFIPDTQELDCHDSHMWPLLHRQKQG